MRIVAFDILRLDLPFDDLYDGPRHKPRGWTQFDHVLLKLTDEAGHEGWGEAFAFACPAATQAVLRDMVQPRVLGREIDDIANFMHWLQVELHIQGRYGITQFALSGLDIALWDLAGQRAGQSISRLLGGRGQNGRWRESIPAYASLVRYGAPGPVAAMATRAAAEGYECVKLHEIAYEPIAAARAALGPDIKLTTDVNCAWSRAEAETMLPRMHDLGLYWVEEPIFPPEDYEAHAALAERHGVALAAGENACTALEFQRLSAALAFPQPSVVKLGGICEFIKVVQHAAQLGRSVMPHSPYFGPGYWATLQLAAHCEAVAQFEFLYVKPERWIGLDMPLPQNGSIRIPDAPGLGFRPDSETLSRFRVS